MFSWYKDTKKEGKKQAFDKVNGMVSYFMVSGWKREDFAILTY